MSRPVRIEEPLYALLDTSPALCSPRLGCIAAYKVRAKMPDGRRGVVSGDSLLDCMRRATQAEVAFIIDQVGHRWRYEGRGIFRSMGLVKRMDTKPVRVVAHGSGL